MLGARQTTTSSDIGVGIELQQQSIRNAAPLLVLEQGRRGGIKRRYYSYQDHHRRTSGGLPGTQPVHAE